MEGKEIRFQVPWGHVAARTYGLPTNPCILMVHGLLDNAASFERLLPLLPQNFYYVCIDLPGHGYSSHFLPGLPLHFFDYVYTIKLVLNSLGCESCYAIGHSFGAQLLNYHRIVYPGKIKKLILLDGIVPLPVENSDLLSYLKKSYDLDSYARDTERLYTKDDVLYALRFLRHYPLNSDAAEALFKRSVTKVGDLYKYNRDPRLRRLVLPGFNSEQQMEMLYDFSTPMLLVLASEGNKQIHGIAKFLDETVNDPKRFLSKYVVGNHDVHNNFPERVAVHICQYLSNDIDNLVSKL